jgi:hypothetical protein
MDLFSRAEDPKRVKWTFYFEYRKAGKSPDRDSLELQSGKTFISDANFFRELERFSGQTPEPGPLKEHDRVRIELFEDEKYFSKFAKLIKLQQLQIRGALFPLPEEIGKVVVGTRKVTPTTAELNAAPLLRIRHLEAEMGMIRSNDPKKRVIEPPLLPGEVFVEAYGDQYEKSAPMGRLSGFGVVAVYVNNEAIQSAMDSGMTLKTSPIRWAFWKKTEQIPTSLHPRGGGMLTSDTTMPPCLTPLKFLQGPKVGQQVYNNEGVEIYGKSEPGYQGRFWDDEGRIDPILKFSRKEVEKLESFDVAKTVELVTSTPAGYLPDLIVSQRFRKWCIKNKYRVTFDPVELVDD